MAHLSCPRAMKELVTRRAIGPGENVSAIVAAVHLFWGEAKCWAHHCRADTFRRMGSRGPRANGKGNDKDPSEIVSGNLDQPSHGRSLVRADLQGGMKVGLPHVDSFLPAHKLVSLERLVGTL